MAESNTAEELIPKKGATSVVWNWFGYKRADKEQTTVICKQCKNTVISKGGNTSNLFHHLKHRHPVQYEECQKAREESSTADARKPKQSRLVQHGIAESLASCTPYDRKSKRWKDITQAVTICLAKDMMPIQTVEKEGFKQLVKKLDPRYTLPKRKYFSKTALPDMYEEYREKVEASLSSADYYASTTDLWSSRTTEPYLSLTVHYINSDWELCNSNLETSYFPEDHTGENIATGLREFLQSWHLNEEKQVCVTTDSGANVVKALRLNDWTRLSCFGHRLHIAIGKIPLFIPQLNIRCLDVKVSTKRPEFYICM